MSKKTPEKRVDFGALLSGRARMAALVICAPLAMAVIVCIILLQMHDTSSRFARVFSQLRSAVHGVEFALNGASRSTGVLREGYLYQLEAHYLKALHAYTALRLADPDGDDAAGIGEGDGAPDAVVAAAKARGLNPAQTTIDLDIAGADMPEVFASLWESHAEEEMSASMGHGVVGPGFDRTRPTVSLETSMAVTLLAVERLVASGDAGPIEVDRALRVVVDELGALNHVYLEEISTVLNSRMEWSARTPLYFVLAVFVVAICGVLMSNAVVFRPLSRRLTSMQKELIRARETAQHGEKAKSEFLASMSHEIRTPMNGVMGMAELMAGTQLDTRQRMFVEIIQTSARSLLAIINDILDFSRIDAGHLALDPRPFKLSRLAAEPVQLVSEKAAAKGLELAVRLDPSAERYAVGDFGRLTQIFTNVLSNAVKFTENGQVSVDLKADRRGDKVMLSIVVTDTGVGIPADKLNHIFGRFTQVDQSSARTHEGAGLGLAISKGLIDAMGGDITVESNPGEGATFRISAPLGVHDQGEPMPLVPADARGSRVLVIDDNETNRLIAHELLVSWGFEGVSAHSGREGLQKLLAAAEAGKPFDLILLDHHMPGMDGAETARRIQGAPQIAKTPIILLTSIAQDMTAAICRDLGVRAFLVKPTLPSPLLDAIMNALSGWTAEDGGPHAATRDDAPADRTAPAEVLVVEDNVVNRTVMEHMLGQMSLAHECATDGLEAVATFETMRPKLILMDVSMPGIDGYEATRRIRAIEAKRNWDRTPIVGVTAHAMANDRDRCLKAGMDGYLAKPINVEALTGVIEEHYQRDAEADADMAQPFLSSAAGGAGA